MKAAENNQYIKLSIFIHLNFMTTFSPTKLIAADQLLQGLSLNEKPLDIPGNFRAKQRRRKHDDSKLVFPAPKKKESESFKTHYTHQFRRGKNYRPCPSSPRPCSPTRRNNPHPSKDFLNWRIPTRVFDYGKVKKANMAFLKSNMEDSQQKFYDDYCGRQDGQIDPHQLMEIAKSYATALQEQHKNERKKLPGLKYMKKNGGKVTLGLYSPPNSPVGIKLPNVTRTKMWSPELSQNANAKPRRKGGRKNLLESPELTAELSKPHFSSWFDINANTSTNINNENKNDKNEIPETGEQDFFESDLGLALGSLNPEAILAIEKWLESADEEERQIAMKFLETIILASVEKDGHVSPRGRESPGETYPTISQQLIAPYPGIPKPKKVGGHHHHKMRKNCEVCKKQELESSLQQLQAIASLPTDVPAITELLNPMHPAVLLQQQQGEPSKSTKWNTQRILNRPCQDRGKFVANKGSLFMNSKKPNGRHFTIHPEWQ